MPPRPSEVARGGLPHTVPNEAQEYYRPPPLLAPLAPRAYIGALRRGGPRSELAALPSKRHRPGNPPPHHHTEPAGERVGV